MVSNNRVVKEAKIAEIKEKMGKAQGMVFAKYQGLTVEEDTELRKKLREAGVEYKVFKNTFTIRAAKELGYGEIENVLEGPVSIAFGYEDPTLPARLINDFAKTHKALELKGGLVSGEIYDVDKVKMLASIPPKDVLIAKLLGSIKAPISNFAYMLSAIKDKKESEQQA